MKQSKCNNRQVNGVLILDKDKGCSSNQALQRVKRLYQAKKAGHTGSLDPLATGVLPICFGEATKFSQFLLDADKAYQATVRLGVKTTTGDREGKIIDQRSVKVTLSKLKEVLSGFIGEIEQIPSMYSALKYQGQPLYKLARQGVEVERKSRKVCIKELDLCHFSGDSLRIKVLCSKGTYIRTLAEDIGEQLNCCAHVWSLRRLKSGPYSLKNSYTEKKLQFLKEEANENNLKFSPLKVQLNQKDNQGMNERNEWLESKKGGNLWENNRGLEHLDERLLPIDSALAHFPIVCLNQEEAVSIIQGRIVKSSMQEKTGYFRLYKKVSDCREVFLGLGEMNAEGMVTPKKMLMQLEC